jgi:hypothetical protein
MHAGAIDFGPVLHEELERMHQRFELNELAYLALTSKVELPIRDRLAFALHRRLDQRLVAREWKRVDLAILADDGSTPELLLEAKALYTFDLIGEDVWVDRYPKKVRDDVAALRARSDLVERTQLFALVLATHPRSEAGPQLRQLAKYSRGVGKAIAALGDAAAVLREADAAVRAALPDASDVLCSGEIPGGSAYGIEVAVPYWLIAASPPGMTNPANPSPGTSSVDQLLERARRFRQVDPTLN